MTEKLSKHEDREQVREGVNALRFLGGLLLMVALLLYFFHLAEKPVSRHTLGWLSALFAVLGAVLFGIGSRKLRSLR